MSTITRTAAARVANKLQTLATLLGCPIADLVMTPNEDGSLVAYVDPETGDFVGCGCTAEEALDNGIAEAARWITQPTTPNPEHAKQRALDAVAASYCTALATETGTAPLFHDADAALRAAIKHASPTDADPIGIATEDGDLERPYVHPITAAHATAYKAVLDAFTPPSTPSKG